MKTYTWTSSRQSRRELCCRVVAAVCDTRLGKDAYISEAAEYYLSDLNIALTHPAEKAGSARDVVESAIKNITNAATVIQSPFTDMGPEVLFAMAATGLSQCTVIGRTIVQCSAPCVRPLTEVEQAVEEMRNQVIDEEPNEDDEDKVNLPEQPHMSRMAPASRRSRLKQPRSAPAGC